MMKLTTDPELLKDSGRFTLCERLKWPTPFVRERACVAIADLLRHPQHGAAMSDYLLRWMKAQPFESISANALLPFVRARQDAAENGQGYEPPLGDMADALTYPSLLSWLLFEPLARRHPMRPGTEVQAVLKHSGDPPVGFEPNKFFQKYVQSGLPPIYNWWAVKLEREVRGFRRQWAYEWQQVLQRVGLDPSLAPLEFWMGGHGGDRRSFAADPPVSEVYRSAYLRALAWAAHRARPGKFQMGDFLSLAAETCPVDLELWRLKPRPKPRWWPRSQPPSDVIDTTIADIWRQVESLWDAAQRGEAWDEPGSPAPDAEWMLAQASGLVTGSSTLYDLHIFGAFQKCHGPQVPSLRRVVEWLQGRSMDGGGPLHCRLALPLSFRGVVEAGSLEDYAKDFSDWSLVPATRHARINSSPRWQWWRMYRSVWLPCPPLSDSGVAFGYEDDTLLARGGQRGPVIGRWNDWTCALSESHGQAPAPPNSGQHLLVPREVIRRFEEKTQSRYCWVCLLTGYSRTSAYDEYKPFEDYREFGATRLARS